MTGGLGRGAGIEYQQVSSPIKEEKETPQYLSPLKNNNNSLARKAGPGNETQDWYRPDLGDIPCATLTRANREKIEMRDREIAEKEAELEEIMESISQRK